MEQFYQQVRAYELWALDDDDIHRRFCAQLMRELPDGIDGRPKPPNELYKAIRDLAEGQVELLDEMIEQQPAGQSSRAAQMRAFWAVTLPAALNQQFTGRESPVAPNLQKLELVADAGTSG